MSFGSELAKLSTDARVKKYLTCCAKGRSKILEMMSLERSKIIKAAKKGKTRYTILQSIEIDKDIKVFVNSEETIDDVRFVLEEPTAANNYWYSVIAKW